MSTKGRVEEMCDGPLWARVFGRRDQLRFIARDGYPLVNSLRTP